MSKLTLSKTNKKIAGVCGGLAEWANIDVTIIRILFVASVIVGFGSPLLIYLLLAIILN